jgi:hypothetical protein
MWMLAKMRASPRGVADMAFRSSARSSRRVSAPRSCPLRHKASLYFDGGGGGGSNDGGGGNGGASVTDRAAAGAAGAAGAGAATAAGAAEVVAAATSSWRLSAGASAAVAATAPFPGHSSPKRRAADSVYAPSVSSLFSRCTCQSAS